MVLTETNRTTHSFCSKKTSHPTKIPDLGPGIRSPRSPVGLVHVVPHHHQRQVLLKPDESSKWSCVTGPVERLEYGYPLFFSPPFFSVLSILVGEPSQPKKGLERALLGDLEQVAIAFFQSQWLVFGVKFMEKAATGDPGCVNIEICPPKSVGFLLVARKQA